MPAPERIALIAAGVVTPIGQDVESFWSSLLTGASGISQIERFPVADLRVGRGGEIKKLRREKKIALFSRANPKWVDLSPEVLRWGMGPSLRSGSK